jgi:nucleoside-diphosphate-sugar epimerase
MQENILIIGGTGFIGKHLSRQAKLNNLKVTVLSKNILDKINGVDYEKVNIENIEEVELFFKTRSFEYIINLSGYINHSLFFTNGMTVIKNHFEGLLNIVRCLNRAKLKHFIHIGSSDEYGNNKSPQKENIRESPISPYAFSKTSCSHFLQMLNQTEDFPVTILRLFLTYGPGQSFDRFLPFIIKQCILKKSFPVSEGKQLRDFCYISDIINGILKTLSSKGAFGQIINLASGRPVSIKEVILLVKKLIGTGRPEFGIINYRVGENMSLYADVSKANKFLNWKPSVSLEEGLIETIKSYKKEILVAK